MRLEKTCDSCPEQYDAYQGHERVGYLRLRHGRFRVEYVPELWMAWEATAQKMGSGE